MSSEQSAVDLTDLRKHVFDYSLLSMYSLLFVPDPLEVMMVGLGGGTIPRDMSHYKPNASFDILEIDPYLPTIASKYFFFDNSSKMDIHIGDAFNTVSNLDKKYDILILDAFLTGYTPFHLMSVDFLEEVRGLMGAKSVLCANLCSGHPSFHGQLKTLLAVFNGYDFYTVDGPRNKFTTMLYIAKSVSPDAELGLPSEYFPPMFPSPLIITKEIENAEIFRIE